MQARNIHVPSIVIGVLAATVVLMSMGQSSPVLGPPRIEYGPHPRDMVQIKEGTPYTVPVGRIFVLTAIGVADAQSLPVTLRVNGVDEVASSGGYPGGQTMAVVPPGFMLPGGSGIEVRDTDNSDLNARAWGYLSQP